MTDSPRTTIVVNGTDREVPAGTTVADLVDELVPGDPTGTAVAVDGDVVRRAEWSATDLDDGVRVEVLRAVQGGSR